MSSAVRRYLSISSLVSPPLTSSPKVDNNTTNARRIKGVVFDMDGTLVSPMTEYLREMRIRLNVPPGEDTLLYVSKLPEPEKSAAEETVLAIENRALEEMRLQPGLPELLQFLAHHKIPRAILTRNNRQSVDHMLQQVMTPHHNGQPQVFSFHPIVTRDFQPVKPEPAPLYHIAACWGVRPEELIMVGDHRDDLECGRRAGAVAVLLKDKVNAHFIPLADICLESLDQLIPYLQKGFTLSEVTASN